MKVITAKGLQNFLNEIAPICKSKLGYAVARNIRIINTELTEYNERRDDLIRKYGEEKDGTIVIENGSDNYFKFIEEMKEYDDIDIDINLMKIEEDDLINSSLTAQQMSVLLDFMI